MQKRNILLVLIALFILGCAKNQPIQNPTAHLLSVYLTDNPADLEAVNIDIHSVEVKIDEDIEGDEQQIALLDNNSNNDNLGASGLTLWHGGIPVGDSDQFGKWMAIDFKSGVYDLLQLRNGIDMLLGSVEVAGVVRKIRIALGSNNHVIKNGAQLSLQLQDDSTNRHIYIDVLKESRITDTDGSTAVYLDFDLGRSVKEMDGKYLLFPYLRTLSANRSLEIEGKVLPSEASVLVSVFNEVDTATALPDNIGYFKVRGLKLGRYSVHYHAGNNAYRDTTTIFDFTVNKVVLPPITLNEN